MFFEGYDARAPIRTVNREPRSTSSRSPDCPALSRRAKSVGLTAALLVGMASTAHANAGIPMIIPAWMGMAVVLVPVIVLERLVLKRVLAISWLRSLWVTTASNLTSTVVGIPLTWVVLLAVQLLYSSLGIRIDYQVPVQRFLEFLPSSAWIFAGGDDGNWMVPVSMLIVLVGFFFASWAIELRVIKIMQPEQEPLSLRRAVMRANLLSNGLLALILLWALLDWALNHAAA